MDPGAAFLALSGIFLSVAVGFGLWYNLSWERKRKRGGKG